MMNLCGATTEIIQQQPNVTELILHTCVTEIADCVLVAVYKSKRCVVPLSGSLFVVSAATHGLDMPMYVRITNAERKLVTQGISVYFNDDNSVTFATPPTLPMDGFMAVIF